MSWNECLYWYAQDRDGTYFGLKKEENEGALLLEDPKGPILICVQVTYSGQYGTHRDVTVRTRAELERPYALSIKKQSSLRGGVNRVLGGLERGAQALGRKTELTPDYRAPELADDRGIKTNEPEFTRWVLQSRELKELLAAWPDFRLQVGPMGPVGTAHLVEARVTLPGNYNRENPIPRSAATSIPRASLAYPATAQTDSQAPRRCGGGKGGISHEG